MNFRTKGMPMPQRVVSLAAWRDKETAKLVAYLNKRLEEGDLGGLIVQSINQRGKERVHLTGVYHTDPVKAAGAVLKLSVRMTAAIWRV
jgi:hypothetical protein